MYTHLYEYKIIERNILHKILLQTLGKQGKDRSLIKPEFAKKKTKRFVEMGYKIADYQFFGKEYCFALGPI